MNVSNDIRLFLLKIIKGNGNIEPLIDMGYEYFQIFKLIKEEIQDENAEYVNGVLGLTSKGEKDLQELEGAKNKKGSGTWIEPEIQSRISKLDKNDVFLPRQDDLWFN